MSDGDFAQGWTKRQALAAGALALTRPGGALAQAAAPSAPKRKLGELIADYASDYDLAKAPPAAIEAARIAFIDTIGVMLAGSGEEVAHIAFDMVVQEGGARKSTIAGRGRRTSPQLAALANGVAAHGMDFDLTYMSGQSTAGIIPALLAVAEPVGASPREVVAAFIVACEIAARLIRASPQTSALGGWHATGMVGNIAGAVACARLLKLSRQQMAEVVGISVSLASGVSENFGTMTKPLHSGNAARNAVTAAMLASRGFTSSAQALEGKAGYFATVSRALPTDLSVFEDLGRTDNIVDPSYKLKRYPCGGLSHTSIDAALALRAEFVGSLDDIARIEVGVTKNASQRITSDYPNSIESAKFSMPYIGAWTLIHGAPSLATFTEKAIDDPRVKALSTKISHHVDSEFADELLHSPGRVVVTMKNGARLEKKVWYASGTLQNPMSSTQIEAKFMDCATHALRKEQAAKLYAWLADLPKQSSFRDFWPMLKA